MQTTPASTPSGPIRNDGHPQQWLVGRRNDGATPDVVADELVAAGWDADKAAAAALRSLRSSDHHRLVYWTLTFAVGFAALSAGSVLHLALREDPSRLDLARWITVLCIAVPLAALAWHWSVRVEAADRFAVWSPTRRALFGTLAGCSAAVGLWRLSGYLFEMVAAAVGVDGYEFTPSSLAQVLVSLGIAGPLFAWSLREWRRSNLLRRSLQHRA